MSISSINHAPIRYQSVIPFLPPAQPVKPMGLQNDTFSSLSSGHASTDQFKDAGNEFRKRRLYPQAIQAYETAIRLNPRYTDAYFNLAQLMVLLGNAPRGIQLLTQLLYVNPNDHDARVQLGEYYEKIGNTQEAKKRYMEVLSVMPDFDPANRRLNFLIYQDQKRFYPETVNTLLQTRQREVVHKARGLLKQYFKLHHPNPYLLKLSQEIPVCFEETQRIDDSPNIAEYDAQQHIIRIHPQMMFSTPNVVGAYLAHELVHALDGESHTSIREEQDGYQELARFWSIYKGVEKDPNLDHALSMYQQSEKRLDEEVRRVYSIRNPGISETSPGHGQPARNPLAKAAQQYDIQITQAKLQRLKQAISPQQKQ